MSDAAYTFTRAQLARILASLDTHGRRANAEQMASAIISAWAREAAESGRPSGATALFADWTITCQQDVPVFDDDPAPCPVMSRYVVERSDGDQSFGWDGRHESCEAHLAEVVSRMVNGDDVRAVVTIRWDAPDNKPEGD